MRSATLTAVLVAGLMLSACGGAADSPAADKTKTVEQVQDDAKSLSEADLKAAIESYQAEIAAEKDPEAARKLKDRLEPYRDELKRREQK